MYFPTEYCWFVTQVGFFCLQPRLVHPDSEGNKSFQYRLKARTETSLKEDIRMLWNDFRSQFVNPVKSTPTYGNLAHKNKITVVKGLCILECF